MQATSKGETTQSAQARFRPSQRMLTMILTATITETSQIMEAGVKSLFDAWFEML
jgi:hypothetical protein